MKKLFLTFSLLLVGTIVWAQAVITGELKRWHKVTVTFNGPNTSETASLNPFSDYNLMVTFTHSSGKSYTVPGYYAADGDAANTSSDSGDNWQVNFAPGLTGTWNYSVSFKTGSDVAINGGGNSAGFIDGNTGSFVVVESDKSGRDHRSASKGRLQYVGEHYLRHSGTDPNNPNGDWFVKAGSDAPENTLAYDDFDNTPDRGGRRKSWSPHQQDYLASDASEYTWDDGKGSELLGVVRYLSDKGVNAFSFLTLSLHGDDENVFPHLLKVPIDTYNGYADAAQWNSGVHKDRFDVSKLAQWEKVFEYADKKGMFMHFKTLETENDNIMDSNGLGLERKLYYRELVARFGHHLALNWNLSEETTLTDDVVKGTASYIRQFDPYDHHIVIHTYPSQQDQRYTPLLGSNSELTGASIQSNISNVHNDVKRWVENSSNAGKKWVVANDEQGGANTGVDQDPNDEKLVRQEVLWGTFLAGGAGVEYYYGYQTGETDLSAQNHRSRDIKYTQASYALRFFQEYFMPYLPNVVSDDDATSVTDDYVLRSEAQTAYAVYLPDGGSTGISLPSASWKVQWFNPRNGQIGNQSDFSGNLVAPDGEDWVALLTSETDPDNNAPIASITSPTNNASFEEGENIVVGANATDSDGSVTKVEFYNGGTKIGEDTTAPYQHTISNAVEGTYNLTVKATDNGGATGTSSVITVNVTNSGGTPLSIPGKIEAEDFNAQSGIQSENTSDDGGGQNIGFIQNGDYADYLVDVSTGGNYEVAFRVASDTQGGTIQVKSGNNLIASLDVPNTGDWQSWTTLSAVFDLAAGEQTLRLEFVGGAGYLLNVNWVDFMLTSGNQPPNISFDTPGDDIVLPFGQPLYVKANADDSDGTIATVELYIDDEFFRTERFDPYEWGADSQNDTFLDNLPVGEYTFLVVATDDEGATASASIMVSVEEEGEPVAVELSPIHDAYLDNGTRYNSGILRVESGRRVTYLQFDLSQVQGEILEASLEMTVASDPGNGYIKIENGENDNWTELNLSTSNDPLAGSLLGSLDQAYQLGETYTWNLDASNIDTGGALSLLISHTSGNDVDFGSKEGSVAVPKLTLVVNESGQQANQLIGFGGEDKAIASPNPFRYELNLKVPECLNAEEVVIKDAIGVEMFRTEVGNGKTLIGVKNAAELKRGTYYMYIKSKDGQIKVHKVIKR